MAIMGKSPASLTHGIAKNTLFNLIGWSWPIMLSLFIVPYTVHTLGNDSYGIFSIISLVAGYLGLLSGPVSMGNVKFMAAAYAKQDWAEFYELAITGVVINSALSLIGALIMFFTSDLLVRKVFQITPAFIPMAISCFRVTALSFFLNGIAASLQGIPMAMRRYDVSNLVQLTVGTLTSVFVVIALLLGGELLGAVWANVLSSTLAVSAFGIVVWLLIRGYRVSNIRFKVNRHFVRRLITFSSLLFTGQLVSQLGLSIDQTIIGVLLGMSAVTYYSVPTKITSRIPSLMAVFSATLYPLSAEAAATGRLNTLGKLYQDVIRLQFCISGLLVSLLIILARDFLSLWMGPEFMAQSWLILVIVAAGVLWRSSGTVAWQVVNGLGRADLSLAASIATLVLIVLPILVLAPQFGTTGVAMGVFIGLFLSNLVFDLFTQRHLLGLRDMKTSLTPYIRIAIVVVSTIVCAQLVPYVITGWMGLVLAALLIVVVYLVLSIISGSVQMAEVRAVWNRTTSALHKLKLVKV